MAAVTLYPSPPPSIGWWPAAAYTYKNTPVDSEEEIRIMRFWNGVTWSVRVDPLKDDPDRFDQFANMPASVETHRIFWRYPNDPGDELPEFPPA